MARVAVRPDAYDATLCHRRHPVAVAVISAGTVPLALEMLLIPGPGLPLAVAFAVLFGAGQGLSSIVRGSVPVVLFGTDGLGLRLGKHAALRNMLGAAAPFLFALSTAGFGIAATLGVTLAVAAGGLAVMLWLWLDVGIVQGPVTPTAVAPPPTN